MLQYYLTGVNGCGNMFSRRTVLKPPVEPSKCTQTDHEIMKDLYDVWQELELVGYQLTKGDWAIECRNCRFCHSTLGRRVSVEFVP